MIGMREMIGLRTFRGNCTFQYVLGLGTDEKVAEYRFRKYGFGFRQHHWLMGFSPASNGLPEERDEYRLWEFDFPLWVPTLVIIIYPLIAIIVLPIQSYRSRCRRQVEHCVKCSYNLTGNESGVCPECGTPAKRHTESQNG
jgi:hypothetical protein